MSRKMFDPTFVKTGVGFEWVFNCRKSAYAAYAFALRLKVIEREFICEVCEDHFHIHAHHDDYKYPLRVRYLCAKCHAIWHSANGSGKHRDAFCKKRTFKFDDLLNRKQIDLCFEEIYEEAKKTEKLSGFKDGVI